MDVSNVAPPPEPEMTPRESLKADFADRLRSAIERKGWTMSETARRASHFLGDGDKFGRAHVWHYVQGKALPRVKYLEALSLALETSPAITLLQCVNSALGSYVQCMNELAITCDVAAQEGCSESFTTLVTEECGAQGIGIFTCISPM